MKKQELFAEIRKIGPLGDASSTVDQLIEKMESLDLSREEPATAVFSALELDVQKRVFIDNPASTWDFSGFYTRFYPRSLRGAVNAVLFALKRNKKIRALGARNSFSLAPQTDGIYVDLSKAFDYSIEQHNEKVDRLDMAPLDRLKTGVDEGRYFNAPAGMTFAMINHILCPDNDTDQQRFGRKRLFNMGGVDFQTFAGAFSTGTHGSGGRYTACHDSVRSIEVVAGDGRVYRVETSRGITDPEKHRAFFESHPEEVPVTLIQDDDKFYSLLVSMGCFGIIYSVIVEVTDMTLLHQEVAYHQYGWTPSFKDRFQADFLPADPQEEYFISLLVNPYQLKKGKLNSVLVKTAAPTDENGRGKSARRRFWPNFLGNLGAAVDVLRHLANAGRRPKRKLIESSLRSQQDDRDRGHGYTDLAYKIWNGGIGKLKTYGTAIEFCVPTAQAPKVLDLLFAMMEQVGRKGKGYYLNAPVSLRFARPSRAYLAPNFHLDQNGREVTEWCFIEIIRVNGTDEKDDIRELEIYEHLQDLLLVMGGRPHWGLNFELNFSDQLLRELYPRFEEWRAAYHFFNPSGVFENQLTAQFGLDRG